MKALVHHGPGTKSWDDVPDPRILKGDVSETKSGRILGHEAVGTGETVGSAVRRA